MTRTMIALRNTAFAVFALFTAATAQAGLIPTVEKRVNNGSQIPPYNGFARTTATAWQSPDGGFNSSPMKDNWVSFALGLTPTNGERITAISVIISSPTGKLAQRWNVTYDDNDERVTFSTPTELNNSVGDGDSHLIQLGSATAVAPTETFVQSGTPQLPPDTFDDATITPGRDYGYGTLMTGTWGYLQTEIDAQADGVSQRFAYIVIPRGSESSLVINVTVATNQVPGGRSFITSDFVPPPAEPGTMTLLGLALAGSLGIRRRPS